MTKPLGPRVSMPFTSRGSRTWSGQSACRSRPTSRSSSMARSISVRQLHSHVHQGPGELLGEHHHPDHGPVGDEVGPPLQIPQLGDAQRHPFHHAYMLLVHTDDVAHPELVLHEDEEPADDILDQALGPKTQGHPGDPGAGHQGPDVHAELLEGHQKEEGHHQHPGRVGEHGTQGLGPPLRLRGDLVVAVVHGAAHGPHYQGHAPQEGQAGDEHQPEVLGLLPDALDGNCLQSHGGCCHLESRVSGRSPRNPAAGLASFRSHSN